MMSLALTRIGKFENLANESNLFNGIHQRMASKFYEALGASIKAHREEASLRQAELAESVGLSRTSITNIERGKQRLFLDQFAEICRVLDVPPSEVMPSSAPSTERVRTTGSKAIHAPSVKKFLARVADGDTE